MQKLELILVLIPLVMLVTGSLICLFIAPYLAGTGDKNMPVIPIYWTDNATFTPSLVYVLFCGIKLD